MQSVKWKLNLEDVKRIGKNALIFLSPVIITELSLLQQGNNNIQIYLIALKVWGLGVILDTFRKLKAN